MFIMQIVCATEPNENNYFTGSRLKSKATDHSSLGPGEQTKPQ